MKKNSDRNKVPHPGKETQDDRGALATIRDIQSGTIQPKSLSEADRQRCVEHLTADGLLTAEVADVLKVSERTIARDRKTLRAANAIERDPGQIGQFVGNLVREAELAVTRIRRASRDKGVAVAVKVDAEHRCWQIVRDLTVRLQSLGYLPTSTQQIQAELTHHIAEPPDLQALQQELQQLQDICQQQGSADPQISAELAIAQQQLLTLVVTSKVDQLSQVIRKGVCS